ncbi:hypothetical protein LRB91_12805 [Leclercia adecarboxylata]|uniref:hypothetical protein n=1 Tax=Leclercia adecarboxylata TaxID=83655 RepID=UPI0022B7C340|nr:hypothetical protein [Leclercia adecarboxylata]MCZ7839693.1 hypothetical protein [Leclercia adecarboxylata]
MAVKFYGGKISQCGIGVVANNDSDIEFHGDFKMEHCGVGFASYASSQELLILLDRAKEHTNEIDELTEKLKDTKPELRKSVLTSSAVFAALTVGSNASTVIQFLIDNYPVLAQLLS